MPRLVYALSAAVFLLAGFLVVARGDRDEPSKTDAVTFTAVRTPAGETIRVAIGDIAFDVPQVELKRNDRLRLLVVPRNGELGTVFPVDLHTPVSKQDLRAIAIKGKSYSLPVRQPSSSAYFYSGDR